MMKRYPDDKELHRITMQEIQKKSRDNARTPMQVGQSHRMLDQALTLTQWSKEKYAGFSTAKPWQKENESYVDINAESQVGIHGSVFEYWASILRLRKSHKDIFVYGTFEMIDMKHDDVFAYTRTFENEKVIVVANFRKESLLWSPPKGVNLRTDKILTSSYGGINLTDGDLALKPFEAFACYVE